MYSVETMEIISLFTKFVFTLVTKAKLTSMAGIIDFYVVSSTITA